MKPFLKSAGGKRWLAEEIGRFMPLTYNNYIEPFPGSAALYFSVKPQKAILSDVNAELIDTFKTVRDLPHRVEAELRRLDSIHSTELYYSIRDLSPQTALERAVRFIYLNRTCWNGLYRVNKKNAFNVPVGTKTAVILPTDDFRLISEQLLLAEIQCCDFEVTINRADSGDLIYVDPPYTVMHNNNGFLKYNQHIFSWQDQVRLRESLIRAQTRGCSVLVSNADHKSVVSLYKGFGDVHKLCRRSRIASDTTARVMTSEILVVGHG